MFLLAACVGGINADIPAILIESYDAYGGSANENPYGNPTDATQTSPAEASRTNLEDSTSSGAISTTSNASALEHPETIPGMTIKVWKVGDLYEIAAWQGVANWFAEYADGTSLDVFTDSPHPLQVVPQLPVINRTRGGGSLLDFYFESSPTSVTARRWVTDGETDASDFYNYANVFVADTTILVPDSDNSYIYEITAMWQQGNSGSFVTYAFYVTASAPVEGPRRTPQLYVSLYTEGLEQPSQYFQSMQLSNNWFPDIVSNDGHSLSGGFCATSYHPLDVWARDFLATLGWAEDAVTFRLYENEAEIELMFSDDFPPHTIYVRRWPASFAAPTDSGVSDMDLWFQYELVEVSNSRFRVVNDGNSYIYEVDAIWQQGRSSYAFRVDTAME